MSLWLCVYVREREHQPACTWTEAEHAVSSAVLPPLCGSPGSWQALLALPGLQRKHLHLLTSRLDVLYGGFPTTVELRVLVILADGVSSPVWGLVKFPFFFRQGHYIALPASTSWVLGWEVCSNMPHTDRFPSEESMNFLYLHHHTSPCLGGPSLPSLPNGRQLKGTKHSTQRVVGVGSGEMAQQ